MLLNDLGAEGSLKKAKVLRENEKHDILKRKPIFFKTIASVNRIINPINSHNVMASPSQREERGEKGK